MTRYAEGTEVPAERSRMEIERTLTRYGADQFMYGTKPDMAVIAFRAAGRNVRFSVPFPPLSEFERTKKGVRHEMKHREQARDQAIKQRWRALALCIKAKLEAVEAGITQFEEEFYAHIVLPGGKTVYEETQQKVALAYESGKTPLLLPHF
jgi:hypothetical protein